jgi:3-hydroxymyristoyl/3-hydroxydecanoyl-(acyl carrier protein) dehydratase
MTTALLPEITAERHAPGHAEYDLRLQPELFPFAGHFPGLPILPGVVQVHWAIRLGERDFVWPGPFLALEQLKFLAVVRPEDRLMLTLDWDAGQQRLRFDYRAGKTRYSRGEVVFSGS